MKIACIGNMNNNFFALVRFLRDAGLDAHLFCFETEAEHFHPSADTFDLEYQKFTRSLQWGDPYGFHETAAKMIAKEIEGFDFIFGCGSAPAFICKAGRAVDIFVPYGGDLFFYPFPEVKSLRSFFQALRLGSFTASQREGIRQARYINTDFAFKLVRSSVDRIRPLGKRLNIGVPMVYTTLLDPEAIQRVQRKSRWFRRFARIRDEFEVVVVHQARHIWRHHSPFLGRKGNDRLVHGFARFVRESRIGARSCLVLFEYGPDFQATKDLVSSLGIEQNVAWFPKMYRKDIMVGLSLADIGTGDFDDGLMLGGVNWEVLAMGKPFMHYLNDKNYADLGHEIYPLMNVRTSDDIANALHDYVARPKFYREMGEAGRAWLLKYGIKKPLDTYLEIIRG